jgi:hypothetical protein
MDKSSLINGYFEMRCVAETGSFFILTYCGSLRGFETPKVVLSDLTKQTLSPE